MRCAPLLEIPVNRAKLLSDFECIENPIKCIIKNPAERLLKCIYKNPDVN
jgi:hypothetical protein